MIPNIAIVRIESRHHRRIRLWVPLILLWLPLLLLSPLILLVLCGACMAGRGSFWRTLSTFVAWLCRGPGTDVPVSTDGNHVTVRIL